MVVLCPRNRATLEKPAGGELLSMVMKINASCILLGVHYTELHMGLSCRPMMPSPACYVGGRLWGEG